MEKARKKIKLYKEERENLPEIGWFQNVYNLWNHNK